jgi:hypothetical protein
MYFFGADRTVPSTDEIGGVCLLRTYGSVFRYWKCLLTNHLYSGRRVSVGSLRTLNFAGTTAEQ